MENESVNQWVDAASIRALAEGLMKPVVAQPPMTAETIYGSGFVGFAESGAAAPVKSAVKAPQKPVVKVPVEPVREKFPTVPTVVSAGKEVMIPKVEAKEGAKPIEVTLTPTGKGKIPPARALARYPSPFKIAAAPVITQPPIFQESPILGKGQPLSKRLSAFGIWLKGEIPAESYFICDRNGEVIVDEVGSSKLIKVARTLAHASASAGRQVGEAAEPSSLHVKVSHDRVLEVIPKQSHFGLVILGVIVPGPLSRETVTAIARSFGAALDEK